MPTNIVFIFGPSCSGKSTLAKALQKSFGKEWAYIDRDILIEQNLCTHETADQALETRIDSLRKNIIIDAQIPWREKRNGEFYFLVLPPLEILLARDKKRTLERARSLDRATNAKNYVVSTFTTLNKMNQTQFDHCFDSSKESLDNEVNTIQSIINYSQFTHKYLWIAIGALSVALTLLIFSTRNEDSK